MRKAIISFIVALAVLAAPFPALSQDKVLTVYTYESFTSEWGPGAKVAEAFEKTCGCKLSYVSVADGVELLTRLKLEGASSKADIVLGLDTNLVSEAKATGFFAAHGIDTSAIKVPGGFSDDTFVPYDYGHFAVIYDTQVMKQPPKSLKELVEGDPDQKIVIEDPRTSTPGLGLLLWVKSVYGADAPAAWAKLKDRVLTVTPRLVGSLRPVHQGRGADGSVLYDLARLSHGGRKHRPLSGGRVFRGALHPDRSGWHHQGCQGSGARQTVPLLCYRARVPVDHPDDQLDDAGCRHQGAVAGGVR